MAIFIDIEALSERQSNMALGAMYKAVGDDHDADIWAQHENPAIRRLVELFTERGLMRLESFRDELIAWLTGERHTHGGTTMPRPAGSMERWTPTEIGLVRLYLETLPPEQWTLDDHMMVVDWLSQRYLPANDLRTEAEWLATRATLMGRVQANLAAITAAQADVVLAALPSTVEAAVSAFKIKPAQRAALDFARVRAAENVVSLADTARHQMRAVVAQHLEKQALRIPGVPGTSLESDLHDKFGDLNRDWRRIAVTEAGNAANAGFLGATKTGSQVQRIERYKGACGFCAKINGRVMTVVDPTKVDKDGDTEVWVGKDNIGRSAAPRKRVGSLLVEREPREMWWTPAGTVHPHCRGRWLPVMEDQPGDDAEFGAWLRAHLSAKPAPAS